VAAVAGLDKPTRCAGDESEEAVGRAGHRRRNPKGDPLEPACHEWSERLILAHAPLLRSAIRNRPIRPALRRASPLDTERPRAVVGSWACRHETRRESGREGCTK
jgi:hypothetical protein